MLLIGKGVQRSPSEAVKWLTDSAFSGFAPAMILLSSIYRRGEEVNPDIVKAYIWCRQSVNFASSKAMASCAITICKKMSNYRKDLPSVYDERKSKFSIIFDDLYLFSLCEDKQNSLARFELVAGLHHRIGARSPFSKLRSAGIDATPQLDIMKKQFDARNFRTAEEFHQTVRNYWLGVGVSRLGVSASSLAIIRIWDSKQILRCIFEMAGNNIIEHPPDTIFKELSRNSLLKTVKIEKASNQSQKNSLERTKQDSTSNLFGDSFKSKISGSPSHDHPILSSSFRAKTGRCSIIESLTRTPTGKTSIISSNSTSEESASVEEKDRRHSRSESVSPVASEGVKTPRGKRGSKFLPESLKSKSRVSESGSLNTTMEEGDRV